MKKFKFKLDGLLKVRGFAEEKCRTELGHMQVMLENKKTEIKNENEFLNMSFTTQDEMLKQGIQSQEIRFFPLYIEGKRQKIGQLKQEREALKEAIEDKRLELIQKRADVKVIEKLKEKAMLKFKKEYNKKMQQTLEEDVMIWMQHKVT
jgi:flagellar protein FliJ